MKTFMPLTLMFAATSALAHPGHGQDTLHIHPHDLLMTVGVVVAIVLAVSIARRK